MSVQNLENSIQLKTKRQISNVKESDVQEITAGHKLSIKRSRTDKQQQIKQKSAQELHLEKIVFNQKDELYKNLQKNAVDNENDSGDENTLQQQKREAVWHDSDDDECTVGDVIPKNKRTETLLGLKGHKNYKEYLVEKSYRAYSQPKWADLDKQNYKDSDDDSDDEELLCTVGFKSKIVKSATLMPNIIQNKRLKDLNRSTYAEGQITSVQFHPTSMVGFVAGNSGVASLYTVDGVKNEKLHSVAFKNFPIKCAKLTKDGDKLIVGSHRKFYYSFDLMTGQETRIFLPKDITKLSLFELSACGKYMAVSGRFGEIHLMHATSKELIYSLKQENPCTSIQFTSDSSKLIAHSSGVEVNIFDLRQKRLQHYFSDDGCISGRTISLSPNNQLLATGSNEGIVNIYNYNEIFLSSTPKPIKTICNLRTAITTTKFNHTSEILGMSSDLVSGAIKLVHFPSGSVFSNFPIQQSRANSSDVGRVTCIEFSPRSGFMALGSRHQKVPLFKLKHFENY